MTFDLDTSLAGPACSKVNVTGQHSRSQDEKYSFFGYFINARYEVTWRRRSIWAKSLVLHLLLSNCGIFCLLI